MKLGNIPDIVNIEIASFSGDYAKQRGSLKDRNLFCWFCRSKGSGHFPHVSIDLSTPTNNLRYFHISFRVLKEQGWSDKLDEVSYSVHMELDQERDTISVTEKTDSSHWRISPNAPLVLGYADMDRKALEFAKVFYSSAFAQFVEHV